MSWNRYEAALLLNYYLDVSEGVLSRQRAVAELSRRLRNGMERSGIVISDTYRNENGISMQMSAIEYLFTDGNRGIPRTSQVFTEIVALYKTRSTEFASILDAAKKIYPTVNEEAQEAKKPYFIEERARTVSAVSEPQAQYTASGDNIEQNATPNSDISQGGIRLKFRQRCAVFNARNKWSKAELQQVEDGRWFLLCHNKLITDVSLSDISDYKRKCGVRPGSWLSCTLLSVYDKEVREAALQHKAIAVLTYNSREHLRITFNEAIVTAVYANEDGRQQTTVKPSTAAPSDEYKPTPVVVPQQHEVSEAVKSVFANCFANGFRLGSAIEAKKFRRAYESANQTPYSGTDEQLDSDARQCGIVYESKMYMPEAVIDEELKSELMAYVQAAFDRGNQCVYYSVLFQEFEPRFLDHKMYSEQMMREYLEYFKGNEWCFLRDCISQQAGDAVDVEKETLRFVKEHGGVVTENEICAGLPMLPPEKIHMAIVFNSDKLVSCGRGMRFHIDNFQITDFEEQAINECITRAVSQYGYMTTAELMSDMQATTPNVFDYNQACGDLGIRNAIRSIFRNQFSFNGNVISEVENPLSSNDVVGAFCANHRSFTLDEISALSGQLETGICFDLLAEHTIRVSHDQFVSRDEVRFDVDATDELLSRLCPGRYISISQLPMLSILPSCGYKWNEYLLESFLACCSRAFKLIHPRYNQDAVVGAMVRAEDSINSFDQLLADAVGLSTVELTKDTVLDFLQKEGYIARRRMRDIEAVIINARQVRNQLKLEEA